MGKSTFRKEREEKMRGLRLACLYSCSCEHARMYGFADRLKKFSLAGEGDEDEIIQMLSRLDSRDYYSLIAKKNQIRDPFDIRVVSYYWRGVPQLKGNLWHNITTLIPIIKLNLQRIRSEMVDECFVQRARVLRVEGSQLIVEYNPVIVKDGSLALTQKTLEKKVENLIPNYSIVSFEVGDNISIHFSTAVEKLAPFDANILSAITLRSLSLFNRFRERGLNAHYK
jgi:hypothetical protein